MDKTFLKKLLEAAALIAVICVVLAGARLLARRVLGLDGGDSYESTVENEAPTQSAAEDPEETDSEADQEETTDDAEANPDGAAAHAEANPEEAAAYVEADPAASAAQAEADSENTAAEEDGNDEAHQAENAAETIYLKDYSDTGSGRYDARLRTIGRVRDNYGNSYDNAICGSRSADWSATEFRVNRQYRYLTGRIVLDEDMRNWNSEDGNEWVSLKVYGDGEFLYESEVLEKGILPQDFTLEIGDVDVLSVEIEGKNCLRLVDAVLTNEDNTAGWSTMETYAAYLERVDYVSLADMYYIDSSWIRNAFIFYDTFTDEDGNAYEDAVGGHEAGIDNWLLYDLGGQFSAISGRILFNPEAGDTWFDNTRVVIYGDGELLYESELVNPGSKPQDFFVDIRGVRQLRVSINGNNHIRVVDCGVYK